jgi:hypothetical protein
MTTWNPLLLDQLTFHWEHALRPRLAGLTDDEYLWEPVPGCWSVRADGIDFEYPEPRPAPVTTIAWRLGHVIVGVLAMRTASHFGGPPADYATWPWAVTAADALAQLDREVEAWRAGVTTLGDEGLLRPSGPAEGPYADLPLAALVLHIHRELIHHGAEICLLRDLYAHREDS